MELPVDICFVVVIVVGMEQTPFVVSDCWIKKEKIITLCNQCEEVFWILFIFKMDNRTEVVV